MFLTISQVLRMWSLSLSQQYIFNMLFGVKVVLIQVIILPLGPHLLSTCIVLILPATILIALGFWQLRILSAILGGPVNAFVVAAQSQLQVVQAVGPQLDCDIQAYLLMVGDVIVVNFLPIFFQPLPSFHAISSHNARQDKQDTIHCTKITTPQDYETRSTTSPTL